MKALDAKGVKIIADISTDQAQIDFSAPVLKAKQADADIVFVYTNEEESARALRELRKQGVTKPIVGETTLVGQKVIELAGEAAQRRRRARGPHGRRADSRDARLPRPFREGIQVRHRPQRHQGLHRRVHPEGRDREGRQVRPQGGRPPRCTA